MEAGEEKRAEELDKLLTTALDGFARPGLLSDRAEPPTTLESQLKASIDHVNAQRAFSQTKPAAKPGPTQVSAPDDRDLEEVTLYAQFRRAWARRKA